MDSRWAVTYKEPSGKNATKVVLAKSGREAAKKVRDWADSVGADGKALKIVRVERV